MEELLRSLSDNALVQALLLGILPAALVDLRAFLLWKKEDGGSYDVWLAAWRWFLGGLMGLVGWGTVQVGLVESKLVQGILTGAMSGIAVDLDKIRGMSGFSEAFAYDWKATAVRAVQGAIVGAGAAYGITFV